MPLMTPNDKPLTIQKDITEKALAEAFARDLITMEEYTFRFKK